MSAVIDAEALARFAQAQLRGSGKYPAGAFYAPRNFLWYLATPYTVTGPYVQGQSEKTLALRADLATRMQAQLICAGLNVYSPIASHHPASLYMTSDDEPDHAGWMGICYEMLDRCDGVIVSTMDGYWGSKGVCLEIERWIAREGKQRLLYASPIRAYEPWEPRFSWQATKVENL